MTQLGINNTGPDGTSHFLGLVMDQLGINHTGPDRASIVPGLSNEPAGHQPCWAI